MDTTQPGGIGFFLAEPRDVTLLKQERASEFVAEVNYNRTDLLMVPFDEVRLGWYYNDLRLALIEHLTHEHIWAAGGHTFQQRTPLNPVLSLSLQELMGRRSGSEFLVVPDVNRMKVGAIVDFTVYEITYDIDLVNERLLELIGLHNASHAGRATKLSRTSLDQYDELLYDIRREHPDFIPNL